MSATVSIRPNSTVIQDADGNIYTSVVIGTQTWMVENLKTTKYRDGSSITNATDNSSWTTDTNGAYCWYDNDISYKSPYGALYNYAAITNAANIAPLGWHVPTSTELETLRDYLGDTTDAGQHLKESGTTHWQASWANNSSGFTAVGNGLRHATTGAFSNILILGSIASSTSYDATYFYSGGLYSNDYSFGVGATANINHHKKTGFAIRLIKD